MGYFRFGFSQSPSFTHLQTMPVSKYFGLMSRGQDTPAGTSSPSEGAQSDSSSTASHTELGQMSYRVVAEQGVAYRSCRLWDEIIEEKALAAKGDIVRVVRISGLGGVTWAECEGSIFLPIEQNRKCFMMRE